LMAKKMFLNLSMTIKVSKLLRVYRFPVHKLVKGQLGREA
jgi:hypothetical protein